MGDELVSKETRWDRILKRHLRYSAANSSFKKSDAIKQLIEKDFIGPARLNSMINGHQSNELILNPAHVMDIRHQMVKRSSSSSSSVSGEDDYHRYRKLRSVENCRAHNLNVEERYLENQLKCFREHLNKRHNSFKITAKNTNTSLLIDNTEIMRSLENGKHCTEDFYQTTTESFQIISTLYTEGQENLKNLLEGFEMDVISSTECENIEGIEFEELEGKELEFKQAEEGKEIEYKEPEEEEEIGLKEPEAVVEPFVRNEIINTFTTEITITGDQGSDLESLSNPQIQENTETSRITEYHEYREITLRECIHQEEGNNGQKPRTQSTSSNDDLDSIISELAEEALNELQREEDQGKQGEIVEIHDGQNPLSSNKEKDPEKWPRSALETDAKKKEEEKEEEDKSMTTTQMKLRSLTVQDKLMLRKYILLWSQYSKIERIDRDQGLCRQSKNRLRKIQLFLDKVRLEKRNLGIQKKPKNEGQESTTDMKGMQKFQEIAISKKYQNKIKVQQDIIDLQRLKLERQERVIMELKLSKISDEAKEARNLLKEQLKTVIKVGEPKSKAKARCLQLIGNLNDSDEGDKLDRLQGRAFLAPKFLQNMQERALERSIKHEQAKQRRMQAEAVREAHRIAQEEAKRLEDEESKRQRIAALREKRRQEKQAKILREEAHQKYLQNTQLAKDFCRKLILRRVGMEAFKRLLHRKREIYFRCQVLRISLYRKTYFHAWLKVYHYAKNERIRKADELYARLLKRQCVRDWFYELKLIQNKTYVAIDWSEFKVSERIFRLWWAHTKRMLLIEEVKFKQASSHHEWHLKWKVLDCWQRLPQILQLEREAEERRQKWRLKIWELLPDYTPNRVDLPYF